MYLGSRLLGVVTLLGIALAIPAAGSADSLEEASPGERALDDPGSRTHAGSSSVSTFRQRLSRWPMLPSSA